VERSEGGRLVESVTDIELRADEAVNFLKYLLNSLLV
jgi:hypothetical protein